MRSRSETRLSTSGLKAMRTIPPTKTRTGWVGMYSGTRTRRTGQKKELKQRVSGPNIYYGINPPWRHRSKTLRSDSDFGYTRRQIPSDEIYQHIPPATVHPFIVIYYICEFCMSSFLGFVDYDILQDFKVLGVIIYIPYCTVFQPPHQYGYVRSQDQLNIRLNFPRVGRAFQTPESGIYVGIEQPPINYNEIRV